MLYAQSHSTDSHSKRNVTSSCPHRRDDQGRTALHLAAEFGLAEVASLLLQNAEEMQTLQQQEASASTETQLPMLELLQVIWPKCTQPCRLFQDELRALTAAHTEPTLTVRLHRTM